MENETMKRFSGGGASCNPAPERFKPKALFKLDFGTKSLSTAKAFTLAEVLITLGILGVVIAMTLPAFIKSYKQRAYNQHVQVFAQKLVEATKQMNIRDDLTPHSDTNDFVNVFKRYIKIVKICDSSHLSGCFTDEIRMGDEIVSIDDLSTSENFGKKTYSTGNIGVSMLDGLNVILSYNPDCPGVDPYNLKDFDTSSCLSYMLDVNGFNKPNKIGQDIYTVGVEVTLPKKNQYVEIPCLTSGGGSCPSSTFKVDIADAVAGEFLGTSNGLSGEANMNASANGAMMSWGLAKKTCEDKGMRLPSWAELHSMYKASTSGKITAFIPGNYWTQESLGVYGPGQAHNCYMGPGGGNCGRKDLTAQNYVRCVEP